MILKHSYVHVHEGIVKCERQILEKSLKNIFILGNKLRGKIITTIIYSIPTARDGGQNDRQERKKKSGLVVVKNQERIRKKQ